MQADPEPFTPQFRQNKLSSIYIPNFNALALAPVAIQSGLCLNLSESPKTGFPVPDQVQHKPGSTATEDG